MRTIQLAVASTAFIFCFVGAPAVTSGAIVLGTFEWAAESGGNGHFYQLIDNQAAISWMDARDDAASRVLNGSAGHLVTITSSGESDFLRNSFPSWIGDPNTNVPGIYAWIGLTDAANEGTYVWVTGEPFSYSNWAPNEPNNLEDEDYVAIWRRNFGSGPLWSWNDFDAMPDNNIAYGGYLVEFDGPFAPVPEPASLAIWGGLGIAGLVAARRRMKPAALQPSSPTPAELIADRYGLLSTIQVDPIGV